MKKEENSPLKFTSLSELHRALGLPRPLHPLVSIVNNVPSDIGKEKLNNSFIMDFYKISYIASISGKLKYGQDFYDFDEGGLFFFAPSQVISCYDSNRDSNGYTLFLHPDFLLNTPLANKIKKYNFFYYSANEALYLSDVEKETIISIFKIIQAELKLPVDKFSRNIIISQLELLFSYSDRFYHRQFITRKITNDKILNRLEDILTKYFNNDLLLKKGVPTVEYISNELNVSSNYLSTMLNVLTGQSTQQHIHDKLIEKAKEKLSVSDLSISEIAYQLGFEHSQSFSRLFKSKTSVSPLEFRRSFQ